MHQLALVGCAHIHTPYFVGLLEQRGDVCFSVVWDHELERAEQFAQRTGAKPVNSAAEAAAAEGVEAVIVCVETCFQEEVIKACVPVGKPMFVEKPLGMNGEQSLRLAALIETAGIVFQTGYFMRYHPPHIQLKQALAEQRFGQINHVYACYSHCGLIDGWFDREWRWMADLDKAGMGAMGDEGVHLVDVLMWLFGPVARVSAVTSMGTGRFKGVDEFGTGQLIFASGVHALIAGSWLDADAPTSLAVHGFTGSASINDGNLNVYSSRYDDNPLPPTTYEYDYRIDARDPINVFLDAVFPSPSSCGLALISVAEAAECRRVMGALYQSAEEERWVAL